jgi:hypothetical protein
MEEFELPLLNESGTFGFEFDFSFDATLATQPLPFPQPVPEAEPVPAAVPLVPPTFTIATPQPVSTGTSEEEEVLQNASSKRKVSWWERQVRIVFLILVCRLVESLPTLQSPQLQPEQAERG